MAAIVAYIISMAPYMICTLPVFVLIRFILYKKHMITIQWRREILLLVFVMFIVGLASQTIIPAFTWSESGIHLVKERVHTTNLVPFKIFAETYEAVVEDGNVDYFIISFLGNIVMFMPIGFFVPLLWKVSDRSVVFIGFCSSLLIEVTQLFLRRGTDVDDLILNTFGVCMGLLIYKLGHKLDLMR